jgi:hypothetical protein
MTTNEPRLDGTKPRGKAFEFICLFFLKMPRSPVVLTYSLTDRLHLRAASLVTPTSSFTSRIATSSESEHGLTQQQPATFHRGKYFPP